jgi:hypothetical protein
MLVSKGVWVGVSRTAALPRLTQPGTWEGGMFGFLLVDQNFDFAARDIRKVLAEFR